jgi:ubiquitin carboxyl-terminal hydrolase 9/24
VYKLKGVVVHTGSADSGHYYSYIESQDGGWFEFNDERVSEFDVKNLGEEAFGGKDGEYTRIRNAYMLFYERKDKRNFSCYQVADPAE